MSLSEVDGKRLEGCMQKSIRVALNKFPTVPPSLQNPKNPGSPVLEIMVNLADLYHYYYLQSYDKAPPNPDPAEFEHVRYLEPCTAFRFQRNGLGANKTKKQNNSNELGEAFCRWFLAEHLEITHVARIDDVRNHGALSWAHGVTVEYNPSTEGDAPDYFCVEPTGQVSLAEAKGTIQAVGFKAKKFATWRNQFNRVRVLDRLGNAMSVKGYIVAMRWAVHTHSPAIFTTLSAEDPQTPGERPFFDESGAFAAAVRSVHYASSLAKIRQPVLSAALATGTTIADDLSFQIIIWECLLPALKGLRFVGGYFPTDPEGVQPFRFHAGKLVAVPNDPLRLDRSSGTFIGIEEKTFRHLVGTARNGPMTINDLPRIERRITGFSGASYLPDGHVLGSIDLFRPIAADLV
ncbi:hypothetical protein [Celeribacter baekdonensis]|uniref:hypothetical protein n=1 Tax=Celeribacter baekdonensis TaxID=875171 RepID=UPI0030DCB84E|tara:strand:+ start:173664 stop:174878 length:1215 start_codon:yes stop_codon:yes gene_type:complete